MKLRYAVPLIFAGMMEMLCGAVKPASIFGSHMVLQRDITIPIWGTAAPGEIVTLTLGAQKRSVITDKAGQWFMRLVPMKAGENYVMKITGSTTKKATVFTDVAVGEVWICSGQSNMEFPLWMSRDGAEKVEASGNPKIRLFHVERQAPVEPATEVRGQWKRCGPETSASFSAVGYFFGREIQRYLNVPVGMIEAAWGGTPAEAWMRQDVLKDEPDFAEILKRRESGPASASPEARQKFEEANKKFQQDMTEWNVQIDQLLSGPGVPLPRWSHPNLELKNWKQMEAPGSWETQAALNLDGSVWLRKVVELPAEMAGQPALLSLGSVDDFDFTWVNGRLVGRTGRETKAFWLAPRRYSIPAGLLKAGPNVILVRCIDQGGGGGFTGQASDMQLKPASGPAIALSGPWQYRVDKKLALHPQMPGGELQNTAGVLYDGMIAPLVPYGIRGAIWYQGESNADRAEQYGKLFSALIRNWRQDWGQGDFPFYFVQLANFMEEQAVPGESDWAELRESQLKTLLVPNTGMAVAIDIGEANDIHPKNKREIGRRLALWALSRTYGATVPDGFLGTVPGLKSFFTKPMVYSGPLYNGYKVEGSAIRVASIRSEAVWWPRARVF